MKVRRHFSSDVHIRQWKTDGQTIDLTDTVDNRSHRSVIYITIYLYKTHSHYLFINESLR